HGARSDFAAWLAHDNPLSRLAGLRAILDLDAIEPAGHQPIERATGAPRPSAPAAPRAAGPDLLLGRRDGVIAGDVQIPIDDLPTHAAFLGGTGSGKTTLVLGVVEQLLLRGVPVVLVDRKGDLTEHAREDVWHTRLDDAARDERRRHLRDK